MENKLEKLTVLVNSCDQYSDLWYPFFTLFKKYWGQHEIPIVLNTESLNYTFEGLFIESVHPKNAGAPYGERIIQALEHVHTEYVISFLDDFFVRKPIDMREIGNIIDRMDNDKQIAYFNCECTPSYCDDEYDKYPGYKRLPMGNEYILNMQVAVWRTDIFKKLWRPDVSPWEWEQICNLTAAKSKKYKFYCSSHVDSGFCCYGRSEFGVSKGKWRSKKDVIPLFEKENINIDFSIRGFLDDDPGYGKNIDSVDNAVNTESRKSVWCRLRNFLNMLGNQMSIVRRCIPHHIPGYTFYLLRHLIINDKKTSVSSYIENQMLKLRENKEKQ